MALFRAIWNGISALRNITVNLLFIAIVIAIVIGLSSQEAETIPSTAVLVVNPSGQIVEQKQGIDPISQLLTSEEQLSETLLSDVLAAIDQGRDDDRIQAMVLSLDHFTYASMSMLEEIGRAILSFRESGKPVYAFGAGYGQSQYFVAAHADEVLLDEHAFPALGGVFLTGFGSFPLYFKSALEKLSVEIHVFRAGDFKSAVEPYTRDDMSEQAKSSNRRWLGELWDRYATGITTQRSISTDAFDTYTNRYDELLAQSDGNSLQLALDQQLVDALMTREAFDERLISLVGTSEDKRFNRIGFREYLSATRPPIALPTPGANQIAVITAKGTILDGEQPNGTIGGETVTNLIRSARENNAVKAVVMRIDSPGGSAAASERIRAQLAMTQRAGKPVVVSMSGVAASGGYWIAATANKIFSQASTITGSIGIFVVLPTLDQSLAQLGITSDGIGTTALSGALDPSRPINPVLESTLNISVASTYRRFLDIVASGRDMPVEAVDDIAQGQVWSGQTALELGLVDAIGDLDDAIASAALLADVSDYEILHVKRELSAREQIIQQLLNISSHLIGQLKNELLWMSGLEPISSEVYSLRMISRSPGIYTQCFACKLNPM